jgi:hypothetical protein
MSQPFRELRERLLRAGVAPRHIRRYLRELTDHLADLVAEEQRAGHTFANAEAVALTRLGTTEHLAQAMLQQPQLRSWTARIPWAIFTLAPLALLAAAYFVACYILWSGWQIFLPAKTTPFVPIDSPTAILYFGIGRNLYIGAPVLTAWAITLLAIRQRLSWLWPTVAFVLVVVIGATASLHTNRPDGGVGQVSMSFLVGSFTFPDTLIRMLVMLPLAALPYLVWRIQNRHVAAS